MKKLALIGLSIAMGAFVACGDDTTETTGSGGNGGSVGGSGGSGGSGGQGGGGGDPCGLDGDDCVEGATPIELDTPASGDVDPVETDADFFAFDGTAGQVIRLSADAKPDETPYHADYVDLVVTLYDEDEQPIARNNDPYLPSRTTQDPLLNTVLPADGTYYVEVRHVCALPDASCDAGWEEAQPERSYTLTLSELDDADTGAVAEVEPNDTAGEATALEFVAATDDKFRTSINWATHTDGDVDIYSFHVPADLDATMPPVVQIGFFGAGADNSGSSSPGGAAWIVDPATDAIMARLDDYDPKANAEALTFGAISLSAPLTADTDYLLYVEAPDATLGDNPFYMFINGSAWTGLAEQDDAGNDTTAEALAEAPAGVVDSGHLWSAGGNMLTASDVDRFSITLPTTLPAPPLYKLHCRGERAGSGVRGLKATLRKGSDDSIIVETAAESLDQHAGLNDQALPPGETTLVMEVSASSQDSTNPATYYGCSLWLYEGD